MRFFSIDTYLADLNVAVDELTPPVDLVGLCQGGWLALVYAARFPGKVRRLVLAGAPVDVDAAESPMSRAVRGIPLSTFESLVRLVPCHSDFDGLTSSHSRMGRSSGATSSSMLLGVPG
jgi:pimeloyl-ACP methyl ester carboxylesterase